MLLAGCFLAVRLALEDAALKIDIALYCGETVTTRQDSLPSSWCPDHHQRYTLLPRQRNAPRMQTKVDAPHSSPKPSPQRNNETGFITIGEAVQRFGIPETSLRAYKKRGKLSFREMLPEQCRVYSGAARRPFLSLLLIWRSWRRAGWRWVSAKWPPHPSWRSRRMHSPIQ